MKTFSVIIPSYNCKSYIEETIKSLINVDYDKTKLEVIIVDDGSTDDSYDYVNKLIVGHSFIKQYKKNNGNWGSVINFVRKNQLAKNDIISILDSDDRYTKDAFRIVNKYIKDADIFAGAYYRFNGKRVTSKVLVYWFLWKRLITKKQQMNSPYCLPLPFFLKKEIFYKLKDIREKVAFQDPDYFSQIINLAKSLRFNHKATGYYYFNRSHNSRSIEWNDNRFEAELFACHKLIENNAAECVSYRMNTLKFFKIIKEKKIRFSINKKLKFLWFPWYFRWAYNIIFLLIQKKYFKIKKYAN